MNYKGEILFSIIFIASIFYVDSLINIQGHNTSVAEQKLLSENGVELKRENAPKLRPLFSGMMSGPHATFISNQSCEKCHTSSIGTRIGDKIIPRIPHRIIDNCNSCHSVAHY